jgi:putative transposase
MRAYKIRIYPNQEQTTQISKTFGCCRFLWNQTLSDFKKSYKENKIFSSRTLKQFKEEFPWLSETSEQSKNCVLMDFKTALSRFLKDKKTSKSVKTKFPRFKSKKNKQSYRTCQVSKKLFQGNKINLQLLGLVKCKNSFDIDFSTLNIKNITVKKTPSGKYFAVLLVENPPKKVYPSTSKEIGIDLGLKDFAILSDGVKVTNPKYFEKAEERLYKVSKAFSRTIKGSKNREKARIKLAKAYEKVTAQRNDFLQKLSTKLVNENQVICLETLSVKGMMRNHHLAKSIQSVSWSSFSNMLEYKCKEANKSFVKIDRFFPSSKICHYCGYKNDKLTLKDRTWICPSCHSELDRDLNASKNILQEGLNLLNRRAYGDSLCKLGTSATE